MDTNTPTLTEEEKKYLESYKEENPFLNHYQIFTKKEQCYQKNRYLL